MSYTKNVLNSYSGIWFTTFFHPRMLGDAIHLTEHLGKGWWFIRGGSRGWSICRSLCVYPNRAIGAKKGFEICSSPCFFGHLVVVYSDIYPWKNTIVLFLLVFGIYIVDLQNTNLNFQPFGQPFFVVWLWWNCWIEGYMSHGSGEKTQKKTRNCREKNKKYAGAGVYFTLWLKYLMSWDAITIMYRGEICSQYLWILFTE